MYRFGQEILSAYVHFPPAFFTFARQGFAIQWWPFEPLLICHQALLR
jgi:hypothetical protein